MQELSGATFPITVIFQCNQNKASPENCHLQVHKLKLEAVGCLPCWSFNSGPSSVEYAGKITLQEMFRYLLNPVKLCGI